MSRGKHYTPAQAQLIRDNYGRMPLRELARMVRRRQQSVRAYAIYHGIKSPRRRVPTWSCAHCLTPGDERPLLRFGLSVRRGGRQRGAGSIVLCEACWQTLRLHRPYTIG